MQLQDYVMEMELTKKLCPNCSRHDEDYVEYVDRYGRERLDGSEGWYCGRCGFCFETD